MDIKSALGIIPITALLLLTSCGSGKQNNTTDTEEIAKVKVQVATATVREVEQQGSFTATVQAETTNNIAPQSAGRIKKIYVEVGDRVARGQKLAEMDAANLEQTTLQLENTKTEFERIDELYKVGGTSKSSWDSKKLAYDVAKTTYNNLLENTTLVSPISGIVTKRNYDSGDMYSMGAPIYVVEQLRPVKLIVNVSEALFTKVKKGMEVDVTLDVYGDEKFKGAVTLIYPSIDSETRTFPVEVKISNTDERVRPGMFARVVFTYGSENRVVIPDRAVQKQAGAADRYVYVCKNGVAEYRKVDLGRLMGDQYEVVSGVNDKDVVAITGQSRLNDGTEVEVIN